MSLCFGYLDTLQIFFIYLRTGNEETQGDARENEAPGAAESASFLEANVVRAARGRP